MLFFLKCFPSAQFLSRVVAAGWWWLFLKKYFTYLTERVRMTEWRAQAGKWGEGLGGRSGLPTEQGAQHGALSQDPRI